MNVRQLAVTKKDIRGVTLNKQVFAVLLIVPLALTIVLPSIFVLVTAFAPDAASDFQKILDMLPADNGARSQQQRIFGLILNNIMPVFFLMIPIMASSVMAASSFVGEKEKHTLETLLYSPELKFYSNRVKMDEDFNTSIKGLHCLGDSSGWTRGLMMASVMGVLMGRKLV